MDVCRPGFRPVQEKMNTNFFEIAEVPIEVIIPDGLDVFMLMPSFAAFAVDASCCDAPLFRLDASLPAGALDSLPAGLVVDETVNDMGRLRLSLSGSGLLLDINYVSRGPVHRMYVDRDFRSASASLCWTDPHVGDALSSMLRAACSQALVPCGVLSFHASAVELDEKAYMFLGPSGTGKSTHAALWRSAFNGCTLLNDDNPFVVVRSDGAFVCGSPWSGKTPCYLRRVRPLGGIARIRRAPFNRFTPLSDASVFSALLPSCSGIKADAGAFGCLCDVLSALSAVAPAGIMDCLPDVAAALVCRRGIENIQTKQSINHI